MWRRCREILQQEGDLDKKLPSYQPRQQQLEMAEAICEAIEKQRSLVVEAGTGTGKTFAYLIPVLLSKSKTIIATGTKNLQDQLFFRDLPFIQKLLKIPVKLSLLKGRSNYLCHYRIEQNQYGDELSPSNQKAMMKISEQIPRLNHGEISEIQGVAEDSQVWSYATSTIENCLGTDCTYYEDCFLVKARRRAQTADIVVINHHLFFADAAIKQNEFGDVLPDVDTVIFDEAHQLPEVARQFFGKRFSSRQIQLFFTDLRTEWHVAAGDQTQLPDVLNRIEHLLKQFHMALGVSGTKKPWATLKRNAGVIRIREELFEEFEFLTNLLNQLSERSKGLEQCGERAEHLITLFSELTLFQQQDIVHWFEVYNRGFSVYFTPISVQEPCRELFKNTNRTWVFTSATLAVGKTLDHFAKAVGVIDAKQLVLSSPFDYQNQSLLYAPRYLPDPKSRDYVSAMTDAMIPIIDALGGRTMMLFTSYSALNATHTYLEKKINMPLFVQGNMPKDKLVKEFVRAPHGVLLATQSFWEGVDIKGDKLSCVMIDKIPFMNPDDPILQARISDFKAKGGDPFVEFQLPMAAMNLKQGTGRLIRDINDKGILVIMDPRLLSRGYGPWLLTNLPPMRRTRDLKAVMIMIKAMAA